MSKHTQLPWTTEMLYGVITDGCLTTREATHLKMRILEGSSREQIASKIGLTASGVDKELPKIKRKYDNCRRQYPDRYPERDI